MSGIVGVWNLDGKPVERALLGELNATLAHRGPDGAGVWVRGAIGLACRLLRVTPEAASEVQPCVHASGAGLVFDGRLDNREELLAALPESPGVSAAAPDPTLILAAYEAFGDRFLSRLTGDFALGLFDPALRRLLLGRDALGVRPLYYSRTGSSFLFASEIKALLAHPDLPVRPNDDVLAEFFIHGSSLDNQGLTCFEGVLSLLPGSLMVITPGGAVTRQYWDFDPSRRVVLGSFGEYIEAFRHYFGQAVRRRLRSAYPVAVSVSGGLDSSAVFCLAESQARRDPARHPPILGLSHTSTDGSPSDEQAFIAEIERAYGIEIERVPPRVGFLRGARGLVWHVEAPVMDEQWDTTDALLRAVRQRGARVLLTGHWGDEMLFESAYLVDLFDRLAWGEVWGHWMELRRWRAMDPRFIRLRFVRDLVRHHVPYTLVSVLRRVRAELMPARWDRPWYSEALRKRARRYASQRTSIGVEPRATAHARALYEETKSRSHLLFADWNNKVAAKHGLEMAFPFLDRDLIAFLMAIPGEVQAWKGVPRALLREAMRGVLPDAIAGRTWKASVGHLDIEALERDYPRLAESLPPDALAVRRGYVKGDVLQEQLVRLKDRIRDPGCDTGSRLADLLGFELWLQLFLGETRNGHQGSGTPEPEPMAIGGSG